MKNYKNFNNQISVHGLDIGNAACKSHTGIIFDSKITTIEPLTKADKLVMNNKACWLGIGNLDTTYRKIEKKNYDKFVFGLLGLTTKTVHNNVCLGLPLGQFKDKQLLMDMIMRDNSRIIEINGKEKSIIIDDIEVMPEGVSTLRDDEECIVVDIGGLTTDAAYVINENGMRKVENPISIATGTINLQMDLINKINNRYGLDLKINHAQRILREGLLLDGKYENVDFALEAYKEYTEDLINQLRVNYSIRTNRISLTGGGSILLHNLLREALGEGVALQNNPVFANAENFFEFGVSIWEGDF